MPDLDLKPDDYRVRDEHGRWFQRDSKPALLMLAAFVVFMIGLMWWNRAEFEETGWLIFFITMMAGAGGAALALVFKDVY